MVKQRNFLTKCALNTGKYSPVLIVKGGYLDFSHLIELKKYIYHWNVYEKREGKKNHQ